MTALDHPIRVTTFRDAGASTKREGETTLRELIPMLRDTRAASKAELPWLKLAAFGDIRTDKGSLRHNSNILHIYGIEADYDGEQMTLSRARQIIGSAGLAAIIYTSPSHAADRPRWRVLCPVSKPLLGSERAGLLSRLNGLFLGALADESFVLSQSYYFGAIHGATDHAVIAIDGKFIDQAHELNAGALGRSLPKKPAQAAAGTAPRLEGEASPYGRRALENECQAIRTAGHGQKHHTLNRAAYSVGGLVSGGHIQEGFAFRELSAALNSIAAACDDFDHAQRTLQQAFEDGMASPRAVQTARAKIGERPANPSPTAVGGAWPEPVDFLGDAELTGAPLLRPEHLPEAIAPFVFDTAARMGVDPAMVALSATVACASVISDEWAVQPRMFDDTWVENARLWATNVGGPGIMKTPVLNATTKPVEALEAEARDRHAEAMRRWKADVAAAKAEGTSAGAVPPQPKLERWMVEGTTTEALSEVLRDDDDAKQKAPARKVLVRQDEMSGWLGDMDRYKAGGRGGGDRAAYLRLFNGGRHVIDRVGRGTFAIPNWSACVLGGIQPEPIQRIAKEAADDGLLQRFLYCVPAGQGEGEDRRPDHAALSQYNALFPALAVLRPGGITQHEKPHPVVFHRDAHCHREAINGLVKATAAMPDASPRLKSALAKWPGIYARICLTFHMIDIAAANARGVQPPVVEVISPETAGRAAAYMRDILLPHLLRADALLFLTPQTGHARWIAGFILANDEDRDAGRITLRAVTRAYGALRAPEHRRELLEVMETLEVMGWLRAEPPENAARHPAAWRVNPALHANFATRAADERDRRQRARDEMNEAIRRHRQEAGQ